MARWSAPGAAGNPWRTVAAMSHAQSGESRAPVEPQLIDVTSLVESPDEEEPQSPRPSRRRRTALIVLLALAVAAAAVFATTGWRVIREKDASLSTPDRVAGLERDDREGAVATAEYLRDVLAADVDLDQSIGAVYADPTDARRSILVFGGTALLWRPEESLDRGFDLLSDDAGDVEGVRSVSPGRLGGVAKCGAATSEAGDIAVCGWADHGSIGLVMLPGREVDESSELLLAIREAIQTR
jgi:hypothetical protein